MGRLLCGVVVICGLLLGARAHAAVSCNVDNPLGDISCVHYGDQDPNALPTPEAAWDRQHDNDVTVYDPEGNPLPPTCLNYCPAGMLCRTLDATEVPLDAWSTCTGPRVSSILHTSAADRKLAEQFFDAAGVTTRIELYPESNAKTEEGDPAVVGTIAWALAQLSAAGELRIHNGTYPVGTTLVAGVSGVTIRCANPQTTTLQLKANANTTLLRVGGTGTKVQGVRVLDCGFDGNSGNNATTSLLLDVSEAASTRIEGNFFRYWRTGGVRVAGSDGSVTGMVENALVGNYWFGSDHSGSGNALLLDGSLATDPTDTRIERNDIGGGTATVRTTAVVRITAGAGAIVRGNHVYGGAGSGFTACIEVDDSNATAMQIEQNELENCQHEGLRVTAAGVGGSAVLNNIWQVGELTANTYDGIWAKVNNWTVAYNTIRGVGSNDVRDGVRLETVSFGNNNRLLGNALIPLDATGCAVNVVNGGSNTIEGNRNTHATGCQVVAKDSDTVIARNTTTGGLDILDPVQILSNAGGTAGVGVDSTGLLAPIGTGGVRATDVQCATACIAGSELVDSYAPASHTHDFANVTAGTSTGALLIGAGGSLGTTGGGTITATTAAALGANPGGCAAGEALNDILADGSDETCVDPILESEMDTFAEWITQTGVTGTCNNTTIIRADGQCVADNTGTDTLDNLGDDNLDALQDVTITTPAAAHLIVRNAANTAWVNVPLSTGATIGADGVVTIGSNAVGSAQVSNNTLTADDIADNAVGQGELNETMDFSPTGAWDWTGGNLKVPNNASPPVGACSATNVRVHSDGDPGDRLYLCINGAWTSTGVDSSTGPTIESTEFNSVMPIPAGTKFDWYTHGAPVLFPAVAGTPAEEGSTLINTTASLNRIQYQIGSTDHTVATSTDLAAVAARISTPIAFSNTGAFAAGYNTARYGFGAGTFGYNTTANYFIPVTGPCTATKVRVFIGDASGAALAVPDCTGPDCSFTVVLRKNLSDGITCTLAEGESEKTCTGSVSLVEGDRLQFKFQSTGGSTTAIYPSAGATCVGT